MIGCPPNKCVFLYHPAPPRCFQISKEVLSVSQPTMVKSTSNLDLVKFISEDIIQTKLEKTSASHTKLPYINCLLVKPLRISLESNSICFQWGEVFLGSLWTLSYLFLRKLLIWLPGKKMMAVTANFFWEITVLPKRYQSYHVSQAHLSGRPIWHQNEEIFTSNKLIKVNKKNYLASWWLNQPIRKICSSNWIISPGRDENKKYLSCHHLVGILSIHFFP